MLQFTQSQNKESDNQERRIVVKEINHALQKATAEQKTVSIDINGIQIGVLPITPDEYACFLSKCEAEQFHRRNLIAYYERNKQYQNLNEEFHQECLERAGYGFNEWIDGEKFDAGIRAQAYRGLKIVAMQNEHYGRMFVFAERFAKMAQVLMRWDETKLTPEIMKKSFQITRPSSMNNDTVRIALHRLCEVWAHGDTLAQFLKLNRKEFRKGRLWAASAPEQYTTYKVLSRPVDMKSKQNAHER